MSRGRQTRDGATVRRVQVMLDDVTVERARVLGDGNLSMGIRQAVASLPNDAQQGERGMMAAQTTKGKMMSYTLNDSDCRRILAEIARSDADPIYANAQAAAFFRACREQDQDWWQYASNPNLVEALGGRTADDFLGWRG